MKDTEVWKSRMIIVIGLKKFFFLCGPFLKSLLHLLQYCFCFGSLAGDLCNLSFLTRDKTCSPCIGRQGLNFWTAREVPLLLFFYD